MLTLKYDSYFVILLLNIKDVVNQRFQLWNYYILHSHAYANELICIYLHIREAQCNGFTL